MIPKTNQPGSAEKFTAVNGVVKDEQRRPCQGPQTPVRNLFEIAGGAKNVAPSLFS